MEKWAPTFVTALLTLIGWAFTYGTLVQAMKNTKEKVDKTASDLDEHKKEVWPRVTGLESDVAVLNHDAGIFGNANAAVRRAHKGGD